VGGLEGLEVAVEVDGIELIAVLILVVVGMQGALGVVFSGCMSHDCKQDVV
jgi:hypothetical protein